MNRTLSWDPVTLDAEGNPITDLAGYVVYHGIQDSLFYEGFIVLAPITTCIVTGLAHGFTHYFVVTAFDTSLNESGWSNEVNTVEPAPSLRRMISLSGAAR